MALSSLVSPIAETACPDRGIVGRIESHGEEFGLQLAKKAGSCNHQGCPSCDYVLGGVDDVGPQLVRKAWVCKLP